MLLKIASGLGFASPFVALAGCCIGQTELGVCLVFCAAALCSFWLLVWANVVVDK